jgi:hypothetical protein
MDGTVTSPVIKMTLPANTKAFVGRCYVALLDVHSSIKATTLLRQPPYLCAARIEDEVLT